MKKLEYYKSEKGIFVAIQGRSYGDKRYSFNDQFGVSYRINGKSPQPTQTLGWVFVEGEEELTILSGEVKGESCNFRWKVKDSTPTAIKNMIPEFISQEDSHEWYEDDDYGYSWEIGSECENYEYSSFYTRIYDTKPNYFKEEEVEIKLLGTIESNWAINPTETKYSVWKTNWESDGASVLDIKSIASYDELDEMLTSDLLLHNRPCELSSLQTYRIVRKYISDNIDPKRATITSDYDFCFTVKKKIAIKPFIRTTETKKGNGRSYAKPKLQTHKVNHITVEIFEMTPADESYRGYTPIVGFKGDNLKELAENIKLYLDELMGYINSPLSECECCGGTGHLFEDTYEVNKR